MDVFPFHWHLKVLSWMKYYHVKNLRSNRSFKKSLLNFGFKTSDKFRGLQKPIFFSCFLKFVLPQFQPSRCIHFSKLSNPWKKKIPIFKMWILRQLGHSMTMLIFGNYCFKEKTFFFLIFGKNSKRKTKINLIAPNSLNSNFNTIHY